jgi:hypothetical protein
MESFCFCRVKYPTVIMGIEQALGFPESRIILMIHTSLLRCQALTAFCTATVQYVTACFSSHTSSEAVGALTL